MSEQSKVLLNGWLRLWILLSFIWAIFISTIAWIHIPNPERTYHQSKFLEQVQPQSALYKCPEDIDPFDCETKASTLVIMPNGHRLLLSTPPESPDTNLAAKSYWKILQNEALANKHDFLIKSWLAGLLPPIAFLLAGFAIAWVLRGFDTKKQE
jgi:hypothetical protein